VKVSIHALLLLACIYVSTATILILAGSYFLAAMFLVTYLGAVIILFLYVVMLSNSQEVPLPKEKIEHWPFIISCIFVFGDGLFLHTTSPRKKWSFILEEFLENPFQDAVWIGPQIETLVTILRYKRTYFFEQLEFSCSQS